MWQARASLGTKGMRKKTRCRQTPTVMRFAGQGARTLKHLLYYGTTVCEGRPRAPRAPPRGRGPHWPLPRAAAGSGWDVNRKARVKKNVSRSHITACPCVLWDCLCTLGREVWLVRLCAPSCSSQLMWSVDHTPV